MIRKLPDSTDATDAEAHDISRLQKQCDWVRAENQIQSVDHQDKEALTEIILRTRSNGSLDSENRDTARFSDLQLVGLGAFGMVFSCKDRDQNDLQVALKILRPSRQADRIARERFQEEMRLMSSFTHPSIVRIFGTGEIEQLPYMLAEYADAGSIATLIHENTIPISPRQAAWIVGRIAEAVDEAHSTPILHRDIKPGNILLRSESPEKSEGLGLWPLLSDFGLSKNLGPQSGLPLTFEGEILGTLSYMSPEQVRGQPLKTQSDLFPLGIILHELVHGQHPFLAESDYQTRKNIVQSYPVKPPGLARRVPPSLDAIIAKCLQKKPEDRYAHASDLGKDLDHFLTGQPISVSPPSPWLSAVRWAANHPIVCTFLSTTLCFIFTSILLLSREWQIERELAKDSQALANDRAKISQLFLESMRATNSGINDTILAGQRVLPSALLETLDRQIPLLEDALALSSDDHMLIRQLEIMYHYKSLCHQYGYFRMDRERIDRAHKEALEARSKSLEYIDKLLHEFPEDEKLQVAKINGYFFMGALIPTQNKDEWIRWLDEGIAMAGIFLKKHPAHAAILETATCMRLHRCNSLLSYEPSKYAEEVLPELLEVIEINRMLLKQDCSHSTLFTYACKGFWSRVLAFMELGNYSESLLELERLVEFYQDYDDILRKDWTALDNLFNGYFLACEKLVLDGRYSEAIHIATRWREVATSQNVTDCITVHGHRYPGSEFAVAFPIYYQWLARSKHSPESKEYADATIDLRDAIGRCKSRSPKDLEVLVEAVMKGWPDLEQSTNPKIDSIETALPR